MISGKVLGMHCADHLRIHRYRDRGAIPSQIVAVCRGSALRTAESGELGAFPALSLL